MLGFRAIARQILHVLVKKINSEWNRLTAKIWIFLNFEKSTLFFEISQTSWIELDKFRNKFFSALFFCKLIYIFPLYFWTKIILISTSYTKYPNNRFSSLLNLIDEWFFLYFATLFFYSNIDYMPTKNISYLYTKCLDRQCHRENSIFGVGLLLNSLIFYS